MKKIIFNPISMFLIGGLFGIISRLLDIHTEILGNIFSELSIWILIGTIITLFSNSKKYSMLNVFIFSISVIINYYLIAKLTNGVYNKIFIIGWLIFSFMTPIFSFFVYETKKQNFLSNIIKIGVIVVSILSSVILFDRIRFHDVIINILLILILYSKKLRERL